MQAEANGFGDADFSAVVKALLGEPTNGAGLPRKKADPAKKEAHKKEKQPAH